VRAGPAQGLAAVARPEPVAARPMLMVASRRSCTTLTAPHGRRHAGARPRGVGDDKPPARCAQGFSGPPRVPPSEPGSPPGGASRRCRHVDVLAVEEEAVVGCPRRAQRCSLQLLQQVARDRVGRGGATNVGVEVEGGPREGPERCSLLVAARQRVGRRVEPLGAVLDGEVKPKQLAEPLVLRHGGQPLVQEELQAVVVGADEEPAPPQVRALVPDGLHQPYHYSHAG
jgi:hypothetical protein